MATRGVLLCIDHGANYLGLAISDASWIIARPLMVLERGTRAEDFARIQGIIEKHQIAAIVVGHPGTEVDFDGVSQARTVERWSTRLAAAIDLPVYLWDERYSTFEAEQRSIEAGMSTEGRIDDRAAAVVLQHFIEAHPPEVPLPRAIKHRA